MMATGAALDAVLGRGTGDSGSRKPAEAGQPVAMMAGEPAAVVPKNNRLAAQAARNANLASPLLDACLQLYQETADLGHGRSDMAAVIRALEARSGAAGPPAGE